MILIQVNINIGHFMREHQNNMKNNCKVILF